MHFKATVDRQDFTEPTLFEAHMKATKQHKGIKGAEITRPKVLKSERSPWWGVVRTGYHAEDVVKLPRTTPEEAEWLGRWVMMRDGGIAQVWSLSSVKGQVHLVAPGMSGNVLVEYVPTVDLREADLGELANAFGEESLF